MIGLLQRVTAARVEAGGDCIAEIGRGLLVFVAIERDDTQRQADRLLERVLGYRVFPDRDGKMNLSLRDIGGGLLLVPQFTLAADTAKGTRPGFPPVNDGTEKVFTYLVERAMHDYTDVASGRFGADMQVTLTNDGPVTFMLTVRPARAES